MKIKFNILFNINSRIYDFIYISKIINYINKFKLLNILSFFIYFF